MTGTTVKGVLVPQGPTWDTVVSYELLSRALQVASDGPKGLEIFFRESADGPDPELIDLDGQFNYKNLYPAGEGSGARAVVDQYGIGDLPGVAQMVQITIVNNNTGGLKVRGGFASVIRDMVDMRMTNSEEQRAYAIRTIAGVVKLFLAYHADTPAEKPGFEEALGADLLKQVEDLCQTIPVTGLDDIDPRALSILTLDGYLRELWNAGTTPEGTEIDGEYLRGIAEYWLMEWASVDEWLKQGREEAKDNARQINEFRVQGLQCGFVHLTHPRAASMMLSSHRRDLALLAVRNESGHVVVLTRRDFIDLTGVHRALEDREPGQWHFEQARCRGGRFPTDLVQNGSTKRYRVPTSLSDDEIVSVIQKKLVRLGGNRR